MEGYGYSYPTPFSPMRPTEGEFPDHGDGIGEYYGLRPLNENRERRSRSKQRLRRNKRVHSKNDSETKSRSQSLSQSRSRTKSRSVTRSRSHTRSQSRSETRQKEFNYREPGFLDAFRVLYLSPSNNKKNPSKYLATQKHQDRIHEILKSDRYGSKRWYFYPRQKTKSEPPAEEVPESRDSGDRRIKVDGDFFRKYKRSKQVDQDAPIAKLKRWELILYKKLGFIQAV